MNQDALIFAGLIWGTHVLTCFACWFIFGQMHKRRWFARYLIDGGKAPPEKLVRRGTVEVLLDKLTYVGLLYGLYFVWSGQGGTLDVAFPSLWLIPVHLVVYILITDTVFYWAHRLLHVPYFFKRVHRKHHLWRRVRPVSAEFAHLVENVFNLTAMLLGPLLLGANIYIFVIWIAIRMFETELAHSGYGFGGISSRHAFHHLYPDKGCFGCFWGPWDPLMGTDKAWKAWRRAQKAPDTTAAPAE